VGLLCLATPAGGRLRDEAGGSSDRARCIAREDIPVLAKGDLLSWAVSLVWNRSDGSALTAVW